jgi:hypothetical protein
MSDNVQMLSLPYSGEVLCSCKKHFKRRLRKTVVLYIINPLLGHAHIIFKVISLQLHVYQLHLVIPPETAFWYVQLEEISCCDWSP